MRRHLCRHGKAALGAASIRDSFNSLLTANKESSRRSHDLRRHGLQIVFPHQPKWDAVTEFRILLIQYLSAAVALSPLPKAATSARRDNS
jgi:hypothetical protein